MNGRTIDLLGVEPVVSSAQNTKVSLVMVSKERKGFLVIDLKFRLLMTARSVGPVELAPIACPVEDTPAHDRWNRA